VNPRLARGYRRLLWIYPSGPRRDELLDTLLECAPPDRRRPAPREAWNLLRYGLRARLGRPGGTAVVVFAVLVALAGGYLGAAGAARLSWELAPSLPTGAARDTLAGTVFPGMTVWGGGDAAPFVPQADGEGIQYGYADYWVEHTAETRDVGTYAATVRDRLAAAGWKVHTPIRLIDDEPGTRTFWASHHGLILEFSDVYWTDRHYYDSDGAAGFELSRAAPPVVWAGGLLGALLGVLVGWLLTGWVSRRTEPRPGLGSLAGVLAGIALVLLVPPVLFGAGSLLPPGSPPREPFWIGFVYLGRSLAIWAGYLAAGILVLAAWPRRRPRLPAGRWRRRSLIVAIALVAVVGCLTATGWYQAARPARASGRPCVPTAPPSEPAGADARLSRVARVFVSQRSTADERNLLQAAIGRVPGARGFIFNSDPRSAEWQRTYCGDSRMPLAVARTLPWYFEIDLSSPGVYPALVAEVSDLPAEVATQHVPE